jgi:release factor glutamine methyltransferase
MTIGTISTRARQRLEQAHIGVPQLTVEVLLCHLLDCEKSHLFAHPEQELNDEQIDRFDQLIEERLAGKPTQYITGVQEFYGREFRVTPDVMIPRPETEFVVETVHRMAPDARRIVDAGTGSGAIAVTCQLESGAEVTATDVSLPALHVARSNAHALGAAVRFVRCDLATALAGNSVDVIASNPPYVPQLDEAGLQREVREFEPHIALFGGASGLDYYRRLIAESPRVLRPGGWLIVEFGIRQLGPVQDMLGASWTETRVVDDLAGLPRVLAARYSP